MEYDSRNKFAENFRAIMQIRICVGRRRSLKGWTINRAEVGIEKTRKQALIECLFRWKTNAPFNVFLPIRLLRFFHPYLKKSGKVVRESQSIDDKKNIFGDY